MKQRYNIISENVSPKNIHDKKAENGALCTIADVIDSF